MSEKGDRPQRVRVSLETEDNDGFEVGARPAHRSEEGERKEGTGKQTAPGIMGRGKKNKRTKERGPEMRSVTVVSQK